MQEEKSNTQQSWFFRWVLNNKLVSALVVILLLLMIIFMANKVKWFFQPLIEFFTIIFAPILVSGILFYLLNPIVNFLENRYKLKRTIAIILIFILFVGLLWWGIVSVVPIVQGQFHSLSVHIPKYFALLTNNIDEWLTQADFHQLQEQLSKINKDIYQSIGNFGKNLFTHGFSGLSNMVSVVASIVVTIMTVPFLLFYLLRDGKQLVPFITKYLPPKMRQSTTSILGDINDKVSSYIRGQILVAISVSIIYMIGFSIIGLDYGIALGVLAGFFNVIPYLGSWLTMIPVVIIAFVVGGPVMLIKVLCVHLVEQVIESHVLDPIVIGSQMAIHPLTIIFVLLTSGRLFGILGVILGIPGYATLKVIFIHLYEWYRKNSSLFEEEPKEV